tara:strand:+ start:4466 stop:5128 length:663 start_codon:yes stop_codon:yes gene_type:complete
MAQFARLRVLIRRLPESERDEGLGLLAEAEKENKKVKDTIKLLAKDKPALQKERNKLKKEKKKAKDTIKFLAKDKLALQKGRNKLKKENKKAKDTIKFLAKDKLALQKERNKLKKDLEKEKGERKDSEEALGVYTENCEELEDDLGKAQKSHEEEKRLRINIEKELEKEKENRTELVCLSNIGKGIDSKVIDTIIGVFRYQYKKTRVDDAPIAVPVTPVQ